MNKLIFYKKGDENKITLTDRKFLEFIFKYSSFLEKYHDYSLEGLENIPYQSGFILVSNHAFIAYDFLFFMKAYHQKYNKTIRGITDHSIFKIPVLRDLFLKMGIVDGNKENVKKILKEKQGLIVYPGGAKEAMKSDEENYQLRWQGRYGFIETAIENNVPIIPLISIGNDEIFNVYIDGYSIKLKDFPLPLFKGPKKIKITHIIKPPVYLKDNFKTEVEKKTYIRQKQREIKNIFQQELDKLLF